MLTFGRKAIPEATYRVNRLAAYLRHARKVPGWLDGYSAQLIADLSRIQVNAGFAGAVGEIGVHMGRLFILLKLLARPDEMAIAIDVFDDQHLNVDSSGCGNLPEFMSNLQRWASTRNVEVVKSTSLALRPGEIIARVGKCRLFSIDGGHTEECALNDLNLAEAVCADHGVVILDDVFNSSWPGVATGTARYLLNAKSAMRPFAISPNKVYLARQAFHRKYQRELSLSQADFFEKSSRMFGSEVLLFGVEPSSFSPSRRLKRAIKNSPLAPFVRPLKRYMDLAGMRL